MSEAKPMDPDTRSLYYRIRMTVTHPGRRRYTARQMKRMRKKEHAQGIRLH